MVDYSMLYGAISQLEQSRTAEKNMQTKTNEYRVEQIDDSSNTALKSAYIGKEQNLKKLPSILSSSGYSGGPAESHILKLTTDYERERNDIERDRRRDLKEQSLTHQSAMGEIQSKYISPIAEMYAQIADLQLQELKIMMMSK